VNGALLVDKPAGITSHDVVAICRRALGTKSVGHTGTLDPFATGLLVVLVGKATRLARFLDGHEKEYEAVVRLGQGSDTDDATGTLTEPSTLDPRPSTKDVAAALASFTGTQQQLPPAFSAKKIDGQRAYARARKGEEVVLKPVEVTIHSAELLKYEWPDATIRCTVSTGTYIRSLARDLGKKLGTEAHCAELRRTRIGGFRVEGAIGLEQLQAGSEGGPRAEGGWLNASEVVAHLPQQEVTEAEAAHLSHGRSIEGRVAGEAVALVREGELLAIGEVKDGRMHPVVVLEGA
jgi:tRNA pseudouridine55 synthase